jgi:hypothetical protein
MFQTKPTFVALDQKTQSPCVCVSLNFRGALPLIGRMPWRWAEMRGKASVRVYTAAHNCPASAPIQQPFYILT